MQKLCPLLWLLLKKNQPLPFIKHSSATLFFFLIPGFHTLFALENENINVLSVNIHPKKNKWKKMYLVSLCETNSISVMRKLAFVQPVKMLYTMKSCHLKNNQEAIQWQGIVKDRFLAASQSCSFQNLALWILKKSRGGHSLPFVPQKYHH